MRKLLNTLYITTQGSYIRKENETIVVEAKGNKILQLPIHTIDGIVCFGNVLCSPFLIGFCAEKNISISFLTENGKFLAAIRGPVSGNVLLRRDQYRFADNCETTLDIAINIIIGKIINSTVVLKRATRDHADKIDLNKLKKSIFELNCLVDTIRKVSSIEEARGIEGAAAQKYFEVFDELIIIQKEHFFFSGRNRRPPLDNVNALLSYIYTILSHDIRSALETVGLDPAVGFLHRDRPGRYGLALDLMEEFRPIVADRVVLSIINRGQIQPKQFSKSISGAVTMDEDARRTVLIAYQQRKQEKIHHPFIKEDVQIGSLFYIQANLLARHIRGDLDGYPPFFWR